MKTRYGIFFLFTLLACSFHLKAQEISRAPKPELFKSFSPNIPAAINVLEKAFATSSGVAINLNLASNFSFSGTVFSSVQKYHNLSTVIIKSQLFKDAIMSISRRINDDNTVTYVGRIINEKYEDGYELVKDSRGNYSFAKIKTHDLIQDF